MNGPLSARMREVLRDLDRRPAFRARAGWRRPGDRRRISTATALALFQRGLVERRMLRNHEAMVLTNAGRRLLSGTPAETGAPRPTPAEPAPSDYWWLRD